MRVMFAGELSVFFRVDEELAGGRDRQRPPTPGDEFLHARRDQLQPGDVGLPDSGRRRTPGLRREEVATLAGVSIDYLVRLEQGRDTKLSPSVIAALADTLRLDDGQRRELYTLAMVSQSAELCPAPRPLARA